MLTRVTFICLLIIMCCLGQAYGAGTVEVRQARGLILLESVQQWVGLRYQYNNHSSDSGNSNYDSNNFDEIYHVSTSFSLLDPHLLHTSLDGELWLHQNQLSSDASGSSSGNGVRYQYSLTASALDRSWHPVIVYSSIANDTVVAPFSPSYDTQTGRHGIQCSLLKDTSSVKFRFERNSLDVSGAGTDNSTTSDDFQLSGSHDYRGIMSNNIDISLGYQRSTSLGISQAGNSFSLTYGNNLNWGEVRKSSLASLFQWDNVTFGGLPQRNILWEENLQSQLGRALEGEAIYRYNRTTTAISPFVDQDYSVNSFLGILRHHLFESLETRLRGGVTESELMGRSESSSNEAIDLTYRKRLPAKSRLTVDVSAEHRLTDRKFDAGTLVTANKRFTVIQPFDIIDLKITGVLVSGSVTVKGFNAPPPNLQFPPDVTYVEGIHYTVDYTLGHIVWIAAVPVVPTIVVSFTSRFDPSVEFSTNTITVSSTLSLFDNRYLVSGYFLGQNYNIISGLSQGLYDTRIARLQFQAFLGKQTYSLIYNDYAAGPTKYQYVEGLWQYNTTSPLAFHVLVRDRYTMYDATTIFTNQYTNNSLSVSASCSRPIFGLAQAMVSLNFLDEHDDLTGTTDSIFVRGSIRSRFNKLVVELLGSSGARIRSNTTTWDNYFRFEVQRFF